MMTETAYCIELHVFMNYLKVEASLSSVVVVCLHCVFFYSMSVCNNYFKISDFEILILKYLTDFCLSSFRCPNRVCSSPSPSLAQNTL
jgi:hypothetical protein